MVFLWKEFQDFRKHIEKTLNWVKRIPRYTFIFFVSISWSLAIHSAYMTWHYYDISCLETTILVFLKYFSNYWQCAKCVPPLKSSYYCRLAYSFDWLPFSAGINFLLEVTFGCQTHLAGSLVCLAATLTGTPFWLAASFSLHWHLAVSCFLSGSHVWLVPIFWLAAAFGLHHHLDGSCFWLADHFGEYTLFLEDNFDC